MSDKLQQAIDRLRRLKKGIEKSQDIYGVDCTDINKAAREVKAKIICDQRLVIDCCLVSRPLEDYTEFATTLLVEGSRLDLDPVNALAKAMWKRKMMIQ